MMLEEKGDRCEECDEKAIAWIQTKHVCDKCYQKIKYKMRLGS